ncbi:MAG: YraN family protein [Bacteroidales bacterium]|nr:YraN family protein [Bacteroidales bacterium]
MENRSRYRQDLGQEGEDLACGYLIDRGHIILKRNYRCGHLEIDIISFDSEGIHFVEVKTRRDNIQLPPQENVGWRKQRKIAEAAKRFLNSEEGIPFGCHECYFDIVAITFDNGFHKLEWFPQAYIPIYV